MTSARQWREAANAIREQALAFDERARQMDAAEMTLICGVASNSGANGEPLGCGFGVGHVGPHAWASLPTFVAALAAGTPTDTEEERL